MSMQAPINYAAMAGLGGFEAGYNNTNAQFQQLQQAAQLGQERQQAEADKLNELQTTQQMIELYQSGTPDQIAEFSLTNANAGKRLMEQVTARTGAKQEELLGVSEKILTNPANTESVLMDRIQTIQGRGGDPSDTVKLLQEFKQDPRSFVQKNKSFYAMNAPEKYKAYAETMNAGKPKAVKYSNIQFNEAGEPFGVNPSTGAYEKIRGGFVKGKQGPQSVVNVLNRSNKGLTKEQEELAKSRVKRFAGITDSAESAESDIRSVDQLRAINVDTGFGTTAKAEIAKVISALGGDGNELLGVEAEDVEKFNAIAQQQVLNVMSTQKGPQTDQDAQRIEKTVASIGNTKESNDFILDSMEAIANRKIEQSEFWESYLNDEANNGSLKGVDVAWRKHKKENPMVSDVVANPETGNPMFYYQFRDMFRSKGFSDSEIKDAWKAKTGGK